MTTTYLQNILGADPDAKLALREVPALRQCSETLLELIYRYGKVAALRPGQELTREGDFDQWVYFVISGRLTVHMGADQVDTISSSMLGENCILGEGRRATLRAAAGGVTALGVDMALLDALRSRSEAVPDPARLSVELLTIICAEVIARIVEMEFNLIDFSYKYGSHLRTERLGEILREIALGVYQDDRETNFAIHRHLLRNDPVGLSRTVHADGFRVDTRRYYADAVLAGAHEHLYNLALAILALREPSNGRALPQAIPDEDSPTFRAYVEQVHALLGRQLGVASWQAASVRALSIGVERRMELDSEQRVDLDGLIAWLMEEYHVTPDGCVELLMELLRESSAFIARMNTHTKGMMQELTKTRFAKELSTAAARAEGGDPDAYYKATPLEELIPYFSKHILDVYLVQPFMSRVEPHETDDPPDTPGDSTSAPVEPSNPASGRGGLLSSLFD